MYTLQQLPGRSGRTERVPSAGIVSAARPRIRRQSCGTTGNSGGARFSPGGSHAALETMNSCHKEGGNEKRILGLREAGRIEALLVAREPGSLFRCRHACARTKALPARCRHNARNKVTFCAQRKPRACLNGEGTLAKNADTLVAFFSSMRIRRNPSAPSWRRAGLWECAGSSTAKPAPASAAAGVKATRLADNPSDTSPTAQSGNFNYARSAGARGVANGGNHAPSFMRPPCQRHVSQQNTARHARRESGGNAGRDGFTAVHCRNHLRSPK